MAEFLKRIVEHLDRIIASHTDSARSTSSLSPSLGALRRDETEIGCQIASRMTRGREDARAQPKPLPADQHTRRIAAAIAKGRPPPLTPDLDLYLESSPHEIFAAFEGAVRHMAPAGNEALAS
jgi:hypothetical protein